MTKIFWALCAPLICIAQAHALCVQGPQAKLFKEPNVHSQVTWVVGKFMPLSEVDESGLWYKVEDLEGETHWVPKRSVTKTVECLVIKRPVTVLKPPSASEDDENEGAADRYSPFKKIKKAGEWLLVQDDVGVSYWVAESSVWIPKLKKKTIVIEF